MKTLDEMDSRLTSWFWNVRDQFKGKTKEEIQKKYKASALPYAVLMSHLQGDFNISTILRTANNFGASRMFYYGKRKWDRRGACGSHNFFNMDHLTSFEEVKQLKNEYAFIALENFGETISLKTFDWKTDKKPLIIIGEEGNGICSEILELSDVRIEIPSLGTVRSLNAGVAAGIAINDLLTKKFL